MKTTWVHTHLPRLTAGKRDCLSVKIPGQRITYASEVLLTDVTFKVHEGGRRRCLATGVRNVHAWVVGAEQRRATDTEPVERLSAWRRALYDPFKGASFVDSETLEPVTHATAAFISGKYVHYLP